MTRRRNQGASSAAPVAGDAEIISLLQRATVLRREHDKAPHDGLVNYKLDEANSLADRAEKIKAVSLIGIAAKIAFSREFNDQDMEQPMQESACGDVLRLAEMAGGIDTGRIVQDALANTRLDAVADAMRCCADLLIESDPGTDEGLGYLIDRMQEHATELHVEVSKLCGEAAPRFGNGGAE